MKEYIPILVKSFNEMYFRYYTNTKLTKISEDISYNECIKLYQIVCDDTIFDMDVKFTLEDLFTIKFTPYYNVNSKTMIKIMNRLSEANEKISNSGKYIGFYIPKDIIKVLSKSSNSYLVGGCIRDILTNKQPKDLDFVTDIPYDELTVLFKNSGFTVKETGKQFLVMVVSKDGRDYEVANFRTDNYSDNKITGVSIGDIYSDGNRRDFFINSLYYSLSNNIIKDPTGQGLNDISTNILRFIGKAEDRLAEDPLRVMRFYRFVSKGFNPDPKSLTAVRRMFDSCIKNTNPERIKNEIEKMVL